MSEETRPEKGPIGFSEKGRKEKLETFRGEISALRDAEKATGKTAHFTHLPEFNHEDLTIDDMEIWEKVKDRTITREDLRKYDETLDLVENGIKKGLKPGVSVSRNVFRAFINNKAVPILIEREMSGIDLNI